ncbi:YHYH domain-containing protein [Pleionea sp. CnH1-48]|uniref:YHYH domain-containing protein n=1 Tax=Pleionea sp. CnH1-48 TaxID=2954494 RepID=UPI002096D63E|nr:YHYH domain-containing protein [Pleionea sp. CnH1-48]MCO7223497.1 HNH endonuclease [Pleionea sp. CnH1-48]
MNYFLILVIGAFMVSANAHGGRTNKDGCHENKKTGVYHCHGEKLQYSTLTKTKNESQKLLNYRRSDYEHWIDRDDDCQNERQELLIKTSQKKVRFTNSKKCTVFSGRWYDPYSGDTFTRASDLDVDHVVPLLWAHNHGGYQWSKAKKREFANDTENLLVVLDRLNSQKSASGPDSWLPPQFFYQCEYVEKFDSIVKKYKLKYQSGEKAFIQKFLAEC